MKSRSSKRIRRKEKERRYAFESNSQELPRDNYMVVQNPSTTNETKIENYYENIQEYAEPIQNIPYNLQSQAQDYRRDIIRRSILKKQRLQQSVPSMQYTQQSPFSMSSTYPTSVLGVEQQLNIPRNPYLVLENSTVQSNSVPPQPLFFEYPNMFQPNTNEYICLQNFHGIRIIGEGSFGRIYESRHKLDGKQYAIKGVHKLTILEKNHLHHIVCEKEVLEILMDSYNRTPYIVEYFGSMQDENYIFFVFELITGTDLFTLLKSCQKFTSDVAKFYMSELLVAINTIHEHNIIYRDLKPENILIKRDGHIVLVDFGFSKILRHREDTFTVCGSVDYIAPEVIMKKGHSFAADYWSIGILLFELLVGSPPFCNKKSKKNLKAICKEDVVIPFWVDHVAQDLIRKLLEKNPKIRKKNFENGFEDIFNHPWFKGVDWDRIRDRDFPAPLRPSHLHSYNHERVISSPSFTYECIAYRNLTRNEQDLFHHF